MLPTRELTVQGLEKQIGVNYFGHFYLTNLLMDELSKSKQARIINVTCIAYKIFVVK